MSYYWVIDYHRARNGSIRPVVIGGRAFTTEVRAQQYIDEANLSPKAEIIELNTSDTSKATRAIKARLIRRYRDLDKGLTRAVHTDST